MSERPRLTMMLLTALALAPVACGPTSQQVDAPKAQPMVLTVPAIQRMVLSGETPAIMLGEIQRTGTVYDLTTEQAKRLRADGMPASLISEMQLTRDNAVRQEPSLGTSRERWKEIDGYWYGGLPLGWPSAWVRKGPTPGASFR
jgi:hypothetical protein